MKNVIQVVAAIVIVAASIGNAVAQTTYLYNSHNDLRSSERAISGPTYFYNRNHNCYIQHHIFYNRHHNLNTQHYCDNWRNDFFGTFRR